MKAFQEELLAADTDQDFIAVLKTVETKEEALEFLKAAMLVVDEKTGGPSDLPVDDQINLLKEFILEKITYQVDGLVAKAKLLEIFEISEAVGLAVPAIPDVQVLIIEVGSARGRSDVRYEGAITVEGHTVNELGLPPKNSDD